MGWWSTHIMGGDSPLDIEDNFYDICGIEKFKGKGIAPLTKKAINEHLDEMEESATKYDVQIGYQVLGYHIMKVGANMPDDLRERIKQGAEADEWAKEDEERKGHIDNFLAHLKAYQPGTPSNLEQDLGLFAQLGARVNNIQDLDTEAMKQRMLKKREELLDDERLTYPPATVFANAPLALEQAIAKSKINLLEEMLNLPLSKFPLPKKEKA